MFLSLFWSAKKIFLFLIWGHFLVERVIFVYFTSKIDDFNVKTRIYREKGIFSPHFEGLNDLRNSLEE